MRIGRRPLNIIIFFLFACHPPVVELNPSAKLREIQVSCEHKQAPKNIFIPCEAVGIFSDNSVKNITQDVQWSSSNLAILEPAQQTSPSWIKGLTAGSGDVIARSNNIEGRYAITITAAVPISLAIAPANQTFRSGTNQQYTSICVFSDSTYFDVTRSASWSSQNQSVAEMGSNFLFPAIFTAREIGSTVIEASFNGVQGNTSVTVFDKVLLTVKIDPLSATVIKGLTHSFTATGIYADFSSSDLTTSVLWSTVDGSIGSISNTAGSQGLFTAIDVGATKVVANFSGFSDVVDVTVVNPTLNSLNISPPSLSLAKGLSQKVIAIGNYSNGTNIDISETAVWVSTDPSIASVSNVAGQRGQITANAIGATTITASQSGKMNSTTVTVGVPVITSIAVGPSNLFLPLGSNQQMTATATYSDGSTADITSSANWSSLNTGIATVSDAMGSKGLSLATGLGAATLSASHSGVTGQINITVTVPQLSSIAINPTNHSLAKGYSVQYSAMGTYTDGSSNDISSSVTWSSLDSAIAAISNSVGSKGLATGAGVGSTTISANLSGVSQQTNITVTAAVLVSIAVTPANTTILPLASVQYTAMGTYSDGSTVNLTTSVTWSSTNATTATISNTAGTKGQASGVTGFGSTTITALDAGGVSGSTLLTGVL